MAIISNSLQAQKGILMGTGFRNSGGGRGYFNAHAFPWQVNANPQFNRTTSFPSGYNIRGWLEALKAGGIAGYSRGQAQVVGSMQATGDVNPTVSQGVATVVINVLRGVLIGGTATGSCTISGYVASVGAVRSNLLIGASPNAIDIADAVWSRLANVYTDSNSMAGQVKTAASESRKSLKTGQFLALK